jgi:hypothetical protein
MIKPLTNFLIIGLFSIVANAADVKEFVAASWKEQQHLGQQNYRSYNPIWFIDGETAKLYLVFDQHFRWSADVQQLGTYWGLGEQPKFLHAWSSKMPYAKLLGASKRLRKRGEESENPILTQKSLDLSLLEAWSLTQEAAAIENARPVVLADRGSRAVFAIISNLVFDGERENIPQLCKEHRPSRRGGGCENFDDYLTVQLALRESEKAIEAGDYRPLKNCAQNLQDYKKIWGKKNPFHKCQLHFELLYASEEEEVSSQLQNYPPKLENSLLYEIGAFELIPTRSMVFMSKYNAAVLSHMVQQGLIETDALARVHADKRVTQFQQRQPLILFLGLVIAILIHYLSGRRAFWLVSLALGFCGFFMIWPVLSGISFGNITHLLYEVTLKAIIDFGTYGIMLCAWLLFIPYWWVAHKILKYFVRKINE